MSSVKKIQWLIIFLSINQPFLHGESYIIYSYIWIPVSSLLSNHSLLVSELIWLIRLLHRPFLSKVLLFVIYRVSFLSISCPFAVLVFKIYGLHLCPESWVLIQTVLYALFSCVPNMYVTWSILTRVFKCPNGTLYVRTGQRHWPNTRSSFFINFIFLFFSGVKMQYCVQWLFMAMLFIHFYLVGLPVLWSALGSLHCLRC